MISLVSYSKSEVVECLGRKPCWSAGGSTNTILADYYRFIVKFSDKVGLHVMRKEIVYIETYILIN